ncbi:MULTISPECIES: hypothetical protein [Paenibacillus]|uniref:hypothetical protein n=1 Tax=Paenibacillus TaxID=44249 RepID=UPI000BBDED60|nr:MULTISPECIES: hypothetical protein [Paenibacillus]MBY0161235.1 hypothetical protein [Cytobacillus firmus]PCL93807.1 hypothetical protein CPZ30_10270 [Paenibacillus lautus]WFB56337.1 hypothetical protein P0X86_20260 [Paenibacillus sp. BR1-192]GIP03962.1 hypothetical protein J28TS4_23690 [Paenibacillus lautus]
MTTHMKSVKRLVLLAIALVMGLAYLPVSVSAEPIGQQSESPAVPSSKDERGQHKPGHMFKAISEFLKLEPQVLRDKLKTSTLAEIAKEQGVSRDAMKAKIMELLKEKIASHPKQLGKSIDYSAAADKLLDAKGGWHKQRMHQRHGRLISDSDELAKLLKTTPDQLKASLQSGKSLAQIAKEQGVPVQSVIDQQVQALTKRLDRKLSEGKVTKEEYEERKSKIAPFVSDVVNGKIKPMKHQHYSKDAG